MQFGLAFSLTNAALIQPRGTSPPPSGNVRVTTTGATRVTTSAATRVTAP